MRGQGGTPTEPVVVEMSDEVAALLDSALALAGDLGAFSADERFTLSAMRAGLSRASEGDEVTGVQVVSILGQDLPDPSDHEASNTGGGLIRCDVDEQLWPCSTVEQALRIQALDTALLEMVDVGWYLTAWTPEQLDPRPLHGRVVGYTDDQEKGRTYRVLRWKAGAPRIDDIRARNVAGMDLPNSKFVRDDYRQLCRHVGKRTGSADGTEVRNIAMALALAQSAT